jgi:hypothetical protein
LGVLIKMVSSGYSPKALPFPTQRFFSSDNDSETLWRSWIGVDVVISAVFLLLGIYLAYAWIFSLTPYAEVEWANLTVDYTVAGALLVLTLATVWFGWRGPVESLLSLGGRVSPSMLFFLALALRLAWVLFSQVTQSSDWALWDKLAQDMFAQGYWLHPGRRTGPSILAGLIYHHLGYHTVLALIPNAFFSAAQVWLVHRIVSSASTRQAAGLAGLILTFWPEHVLYCNLIGGEVQFAFLVLLTVYIFCHHLQFRGWLAMCGIAGLLLGAAQWLRPTAGIFVAALGLCLCLGLWRRPLRLAACLGTTLLGFTLAVSPIVSFNASHLGIFSISPVRLGGWSFLTGTNSKTRGFFSRRDRYMLDTEINRRGGPPAGVDAFLFREQVATSLAWQRIEDDPAAYLETSFLHKPLSLWGWASHLKWSLRTSVLRPYEQAINWISGLYYKYFLGLAALAFIIGRRAWRLDAWFYYAAAALLTSWAHAFFEVQPRYHLMFLPLLAMGTAKLVDFLREKRQATVR